MRESQIQAICRGLQYLIANTPPLEKSDKAKAKRAQVIQALTNACRPSQSDDGGDPSLAKSRSARGKRAPDAGAAAAAPGDRPAGDQPASAAAAPSTPSVIGVNIIVPPDGANVPKVREGSTAGTPFDVTARVSQPEDD